MAYTTDRFTEMFAREESLSGRSTIEFPVLDQTSILNSSSEVMTKTRLFAFAVLLSFALGACRLAAGVGAIAVVEAYDDPHIASDLAFFDTYWGLPKATVQVVYANNSFGALGGGLGPVLNASCGGA